MRLFALALSAEATSPAGRAQGLRWSELGSLGRSDLGPSILSSLPESPASRPGTRGTEGARSGRAGGSGTGPGRGPLASLYIPLQSELGNNHFSCAHAEKEVALVTFGVFCHATHRSHIFVPFSCVFLRSVGDLRPLSAGTQLEKRVKIEVCFLFLRMPGKKQADYFLILSWVLSDQ